MECPACQSENPKTRKFCRECGNKLLLICPQCSFENIPGDKFCGECGYNLSKSTETAALIENVQGTNIYESPSEEIIATSIQTEGERKHVTVLFSDLTGYTVMSEKLDPEEVKEITSRIFGEVSKIVAKYDGFIEKYAGDAVMAIFGVPLAHEDDPIRAIKTAREIHQLVDTISPEVEKKIGQPLSMHTGINTGLVVTGEVNMERGTHGVAGDTINLASRLSNLAKPGEILVDVNTCHQVEGHFTCEYMETTTVKGKADPVRVHKVLSQRHKPVTIHRLSGMRAELVGRNVEMAELSEAVDNLRQGKGRIFSICGAAGTGKSRLVEEFKAGLDLEQIQWIEGHAYAYSQNIPYFPLVDLLNRLLHIEEKDPPEKVREKVEFGLESLVGNQKDLFPYVGGLYSLSYPEAKDVSAEYWKSRLQAAIITVLSSLSKRAPTVFFLEDLHWADPSFVGLLRRACIEIQQPAIVLCAYRPTFSLFTGHQLSGIGNYYREIQLQNLSLSVAQNMLESLLKTETIPPDLKRWVQGKAEGNPFYLEELVNTLIESETLILDNRSWKLTRSITESDISSSLHILISGRLDRLERQTKHILQEASVIGRDFLYDILKRITSLKNGIDGDLDNLERLDLIRTCSMKPELEYMFKHVLTQEIAYNGLLKKHRREIHEKIAAVMESVFQERLAEFYETLAYHFARGQSFAKAVDYLVKSGEKSLARYAVEEAHQYFKKAYDILTSKEEISEAEKIILIDILNSWGYAYYYLGEIKEWIELLKSHQSMAESLSDKARLGMFYAWLGCALITAGKPKDAYAYLRSALELGEKSSAQKVVGYACTWLSWACGWLGSFEEGITYGMRAQEIAESFLSDQYLFFKSFSAICYIYYCQGKTKLVFEGAKRLLDYGERTANSRSKVFGYWMRALGYMARGEIALARKESEKSIGTAVDPFYSQFGKSTLGMSYLFDGQLKEAEDTFRLLSDYCEKRGLDLMSQFANLFLSFINIAKGNMKQGFIRFKETQEVLLKNHMKLWYATSESMLGAVYTRLIIGPSPGLATVAKNIGFIVKNVPFADRKAEENFKKAIENCREMGAKGNLGQALLGLGRLHKAKKRNEKASECFSEAIHLFQKCDAHVFLKQAKEELASLE